MSLPRYRGTVKKTGRSFDLPAAFVWDVRDGKVVRGKECMDTWALTNAGRLLCRCPSRRLGLESFRMRGESSRR